LQSCTAKGVEAVNVTTVFATIKYSAKSKGAWHTIGVGAEADVALD
jgi:hypothetical protein